MVTVTEGKNCMRSHKRKHKGKKKARKKYTGVRAWIHGTGIDKVIEV